MKFWRTVAATATLTVGTVIGAAAAGVGVVNVDMAVAGSAKFAAATKQMQEVDKKYADRVAAMQKELNGLNEAQAKSVIQGKYAPLIQEIITAKQKAQEPVIKALVAATEKVRIEKNLDVVVSAPLQVVARANEEPIVDVTADVAKAMK